MKRQRGNNMMNTWTCSFGSAFVLSAAVQMIGTVNGLEDSILMGGNAVQPSHDNSLDELLASDRGMEDIWAMTSRTAMSEIEAIRLLRNNPYTMSMSLSSSNDNPPSRPPVVEPTQKPGPTTMPVTEVSPTRMPVPKPPANCLEGTTRKEYIFNLLKTITPSDTLLDPTTPQGMAYKYLVSDDQALLDPCSYSTIEQRFGLTTFYFATKGEGWSDNSGWLGDDNECTWFGVDCGNSDNSIYATRLLLRK